MVWKGLKFAFKLFVDSFWISSEVKEEYERVAYLLSIKAIIFHCLITLSRVVYPILGVAFWQKGYANLDKLEGVNREFIEGNWPIIYSLIISFVAVGVIIDLLSLKWPSIARYFYYYECFGVVLWSLSPVNLGDFGELMLMNVMI